MRQHKAKKRILFLLILIALIVIGIRKIDLQSADSFYEQHNGVQTDEDTIKVTLSIDCKNVLENYEKLELGLKEGSYVPEDGVLLKETEYEINQGDTVFDVLVKATKEQKIQMEYQGADSNVYGSVYIQGIGHLYEFSAGPLSGWMYLVNEEVPDYGCSKYTVKEGDRISFRYTCDLGKDLGRKIGNE